MGYTVLACVFGLGLTYPQRIRLGLGDGNFVSGSHLNGIELGSVGGRGFSERPSAFRSAPQQSSKIVPSRVISTSPVQSHTSHNRQPIVSSSRAVGSAGLGSVVTGIPTGVAGPVRLQATHGIPSTKTTHGISGKTGGSRQGGERYKDTFFSGNGGTFRRTGSRQDSPRGFAPTRINNVVGINSQHNVVAAPVVTSVIPQRIHHATHNAAAPAPESHRTTHGAAPAPVQAHHAAHNAVPAPVHTSTKAVAPTQHRAVHNSVEHHASHGNSYGHDEGYGYEQPDPFHFEYGVHDDHYYTDFRESREGDSYGNIKGEYEVALPDGRIQYVHYDADGQYGGTIMDVEYKGEARHPESYGGYSGGYSGGYHAEHGAAQAPSHHE